MTAGETLPINRRERLKVRIHQNIIAAAKAGFSRAGINGITMNEIAADADVSRATLFKYFGNKNEIVAAVSDQMQQNFFAIIDRCIAQTTDPAERVNLVFNEAATSIESAADVTKQFAALSFLAMNDLGDSPSMARFREAFREMLAAGALEDSSELDGLTDLTASIFVGLLHSWLTVADYPLRERMMEAAREISGIINRRMQA